MDDSNRDPAAVSPIASLEWQRSPAQRYFLRYAESTQLPTYTALNSKSTAGLFRGNPNLGREFSRILELSSDFRRNGWSLQVAAFYRWDDRLVDWTFRRGVTARTANAVDIGTLGLELVASRKSASVDLVFGYTYLEKTADYGAATIDASFYALNFARHRLTAAVTWRVGAGLEVRMDNEFRVQEKNLLRAFLSGTLLPSARLARLGAFADDRESLEQRLSGSAGGARRAAPGVARLDQAILTRPPGRRSGNRRGHSSRAFSARKTFRADNLLAPANRIPRARRAVVRPDQSQLPFRHDYLDQPHHRPAPLRPLRADARLERL